MELAFILAIGFGIGNMLVIHFIMQKICDWEESRVKIDEE